MSRERGQCVVSCGVFKLIRLTKWNMQNILFPMTHSLKDKIDLSPSFCLEKSDQFMQYLAQLAGDHVA